MRLLEFFGLTEADFEPVNSTGPAAKGHSQYCVCKGKGWIWGTTYGTTPNGTNTPTPIQGNVKEPCPYGDLRVNKPDPIRNPDPDDEWDL